MLQCKQAIVIYVKRILKIRGECIAIKNINVILRKNAMDVNKLLIKRNLKIIHYNV